jgi:hypothetical protein
MEPSRSLVVLGLDLREDRRTPPSDWDAERRDQFLLRTDVARPLSLDPSVWPSASPEWLDALVSASSDLAVGYGSLRIGAVRSLLAREEFTSLPGTLVAVGVRAVLPIEAMVLARTKQVPLARLESLQAAPKGWIPLGWDVGDAGDLSGLMNYGFHGRNPDTGAEWDDRAAATPFLAALNEHHLLRTEVDAERFLSWRAAASPESPVWRVVHLWDVPRPWLLAGGE